MTDEKEAIGNYTDDENIFGVDWILKIQAPIRKEVEKTIAVEETEEELYFCNGGKKEIK